MPLKQKINYKYFFLFSVGATCVFSLLAKNWLELGIIWIIYFATLLNLLILGYILSQYIKNNKLGSHKLRIIFLSIIKLLILLIAISFGIQFVGNRIIIAMLNYIVQIFIIGIILKCSES